MQLLPAMQSDALGFAGAGAIVVTPNAPVLYLVGGGSTFNPEFNVVGELQSGDDVQIEYQPTGNGWVAPTISNHTVTTNELGGVQFVYNISPDLTTGNYDFRLKFKHPGGSYSNYSNTLQITVPLPTPNLSYRGNSSYTATGSYSANIDIGTASADRLVIVGLVSSTPDNGTTNIFNSVIVNGVSLVKRYSEETDRHKSWWTGIVASGNGAQSVQINVTGLAGVPKIFFVWTMKGYNSATHKAADGKGSNTAAVIAVDAGDVILACHYSGNATYSVNTLSSETFTVRREDNGASFVSFGSLAEAGELVAVQTRASFQLKLENPSSPGSAQSGGKTVINFR